MNGIAVSRCHFVPSLIGATQHLVDRHIVVVVVVVVVVVANGRYVPARIYVPSTTITQ
jgi:hypothetical protein